MSKITSEQLLKAVREEAPDLEWEHSACDLNWRGWASARLVRYEADGVPGITIDAWDGTTGVLADMEFVQGSLTITAEDMTLNQLPHALRQLEAAAAAFWETK